jgi:hypothetical protein
MLRVANFHVAVAPPHFMQPSSFPRFLRVKSACIVQPAWGRQSAQKSTRLQNCLVFAAELKLAKAKVSSGDDIYPININNLKNIQK